MEFLCSNMDVFDDVLGGYEDDYIIFDCPGQIELYVSLSLALPPHQLCWVVVAVSGTVRNTHRLAFVLRCACACTCPPTYTITLLRSQGTRTSR